MSLHAAKDILLIVFVCLFANRSMRVSAKPSWLCEDDPAEPPIPSSCNDVPGNGERTDGEYLINPAPANVPPFTVYCKFGGSQPETHIRHDTMEEMEAETCEPALCYRRNVTYNVTIEQIIALIDKSEGCRQFIKLRCLGVRFITEAGVRFVAWVSRDDQVESYWGGATSQRPGYCACGETGNCTAPANNCNCDQNSAPETSDQGFLTDKNTLPVTAILIGDTGGASEMAWHTLGPLICTGSDA